MKENEVRPVSEILLADDFDVSIGDVLLVHRFTYASTYQCFDYTRGRRKSGMVYCLSGKALYDFGSARYILSPGETVYLPADCHYTVGCEGGEPFKHITVNFLLHEARAPRGSIVENILAGREFHIGGESALMRELFERLVAVWEKKQTGYRLLSRAVLCELLQNYLADALRASQSDEDYARILPAKHFLDEHFTEDVSIGDLAALCALSETHFRRVFTRLFGTPPLDYRRDKRILKAKDLLSSGEYSVSRTASAVGFADANYFSRVFRAVTGINPRAYREKGRGPALPLKGDHPS